MSSTSKRSCASERAAKGHLKYGCHMERKTHFCSSNRGNLIACAGQSWVQRPKGPNCWNPFISSPKSSESPMGTNTILCPQVKHCVGFFFGRQGTMKHGVSSSMSGLGCRRANAVGQLLPRPKAFHRKLSEAFAAPEALGQPGRSSPRRRPELLSFASERRGSRPRDLPCGLREALENAVAVVYVPASDLLIWFRERQFAVPQTLTNKSIALSLLHQTACM